MIRCPRTSPWEKAECRAPRAWSHTTPGGVYSHLDEQGCHGCRSGAAPCFPRNSLGTVCYHFATQLGSRGRFEVAWTGTQARRNADKLGLSDLRWHGLNRQLANKKFLFGSLPVRLKTNPRRKAGGYGKTCWPSDRTSRRVRTPLDSPPMSCRDWSRARTRQFDLR